MFWADIARFLQYFRNRSNSFINILAILQDFNGIFLKYSLNITVLCGLLMDPWVLFRHGLWFIKKLWIKTIVLHLGKCCGVHFKNCIRTNNTKLWLLILYGKLWKIIFSGRIFFIVTVFSRQKFRKKDFEGYSRLLFARQLNKTIFKKILLQDSNRESFCRPMLLTLIIDFTLS